MIRLTHRARCTCGWERSCDAEIAAEVEGEAHLDSMRWPGCAVIIQTVRTWEAPDAP